MEKTKYSDKLKDPRWQKKRLEILERDEWCCRQCYDSESPLAVHHLRYIPGKEPWDYLPEQLITLCESCHSEEYQAMPDAISSLIEQIKDKGFLSFGVQELASAFNGLKLPYPQEITAAIIEHAFRNKEVFSIMSEQYFYHIQREAENRKEAVK
jgi:hypothetical protein